MMTPIYSALQLPKLYEKATEYMSITMSDLVERSANGFANLFRRDYPQERPVYLFAGPDQNGAIALAVARLLVEHGYRVVTYLFYQNGQISELCEQQLRYAFAAGVKLEEVRTQFTPPNLAANTLIIDGLFGCELVQTLGGGFAHLVKWLNSLNAEIVSVDLPSGLFADDNALNNKDCIIQARRTISFETPKLVFFFAEQYRYVGTWQVVPLGIPQEVHRQFKPQYYTQNERVLASLLRPRSPFSSMDDYGKGLLVAGSGGRNGIVALQAKAVYAMGCAEVLVSCPEGEGNTITNLCPEANISRRGDTDYRLPSELRHYSAIALSLGRGALPFSADELRNLFTAYRKPMVLEGEILYTLAEYVNLMEVIPEGSIIILNYSDCSCLLKPQPNDLSYVYAAQSFASRYRVTLILRGTYTAIIRSAGHTYFNTTGNPGMAKFGVDSLLPAMIMGLLAKGCNTLEACLLATYLWGSAADLYAGRYTAESLTASSLLAELPSALAQLR